MNNTSEQIWLNQLILSFMNKYKGQFENFSIKNKIKMLLDDNNYKGKNYFYFFKSELTNLENDEFSYNDFINYLYTTKNNLYIKLMYLNIENQDDVNIIENIFNEHKKNILLSFPVYAINYLFSELNSDEFKLKFDDEMSELLTSNIIYSNSNKLNILKSGVANYSPATVNFLEHYVPYMPESFAIDLKELKSNLLN